LTEVRAFVGLCSYYRNYVEGFSRLAAPLHQLTKKHAHFRWDTEQENAFEELKRRLVSTPVLAAPCDEGQYVLDTDASAVAVGALLQQWQQGQLRVIAYASRCLDKAQRHYCCTRRELYAVIFALKKFRAFLLARTFTLRTDHAALTYLLQTPEPVGQQSRWLDLIAEYNMRIEHRAGTAHRNADALSRRPCIGDGGEECLQCARWRATAGARRVKTRAQTAAKLRAQGRAPAGSTPVPVLVGNEENGIQ
jgi:hypothetical protein